MGRAQGRDRKLARELRPDLIVMGAHGHRGVKDLIFGNTINGVRHEVSAPVLVVGGHPVGSLASRLVSIRLQALLPEEEMAERSNVSPNANA